MKNLIITILTLYFIQICSAETDTIDYFGQTPPGDSAVVFAPGLVSQNNRKERCFTVSPDGKEAFFQIVYGNWVSSAAKYYILNEGQWEEQSIPDSTKGYVIGEPSFSPDGNRLYFSYNPYSTQYQNELFYIEKNDTTWSAPVKLPPNVNFAKGLWHPSVTKNGNLYFAFNARLYVCKKNNTEYEKAVMLPATINSNGANTWDAFVDPDENFIIFKSDKSGGFGSMDIYISFKNENGEWTNMKNMGSKINTANPEDASDITPDGKYLTYSKEKNGETDIYWISISEILDSLKNSNFSPYVNNIIPNQKDTIGNLFSYTIPDSTFFDDNENDTLTLTASLMDDSDLPESLSFNPQTKTLSGVLTKVEWFDIKITATDTYGSSVSDVFRLIVNQATAIDDFSMNKNNMVYPNPASQTIQIKGIDNLLNKVNYQITDLNGRTIKQGILTTKTFDISGLPKGVYLLSLITHDKIITKKIVIE